MTTQGPWFVTERLDGRYTIMSSEDSEGVPVAHTERQPEERLNADLLAAAPALRTRLQQAEELLEEARKELEEFRSYHDREDCTSAFNHPCSDPDAECPIAMGEWFGNKERGMLKRIDAFLAEDKEQW